MGQTGKGYFAGKWGSQINVKGNMSEKEWEDDWKKQSQDGVYDGTFISSDLFIMVPAHRLQRHILLIDSDQGVIRLLDRNIFHVNGDDILDSNPFILAHTHSHYQSMVPFPGSEEYWRNLVVNLVHENRASAVIVNINNSNPSSGSTSN